MGAKLSFPVVSLPRERVVIVTGGNGGIGYEIAKWMSIMGATVIIACRSETRAREAINRMNEEYRELKTQQKIGHLPEHDALALEFMSLDLSSFTSTEKFAEDFKKSGRPLHVLVCNAGIAGPPYEKTNDGFEITLQVNYLSHFLLTAKLLPVMLKSGEDCRIHHVTGDIYKICTFDLSTMNYSDRPDKYRRLEYYARSKLYQIMQTHSMTRRLRGTNVTINTSHPGVVKTNLGSSMEDRTFLMAFFGFLNRLNLFRTPQEGAKTAINSVVNPEYKGVSGKHFVDCMETTPSAVARDTEKQEALWEQTLKYLEGRLSEEELRCLEGGDNPGMDVK